MSTDVQASLINGGFLIAGTLIALAATLLNSYVEARRNRREKLEALSDREHATLHGTFALTNFIKSQLNYFDESRSVHTLTRLSVAQSYMNNIVDQLPADSYRLRASLIGLGLRLEALLFIIGVNIGEGADPNAFPYQALHECLEDFEGELNSLDALLAIELPIITDEELEDLGVMNAIEKGPIRGSQQ